MGSDMLLAAIPLNFTDAARQQYQRWGLTSVEAARPILTARAARFSASRTFGSYPADGQYADTWLNARLDLTDTPTDRVNEITDTMYRQRLTQALTSVLGRWPSDVTLLCDHLSDRQWIATGGPVGADDHPTRSTPEIEIIADSGICDQPITSDDLAVAFPTRTLDVEASPAAPPVFTLDYDRFWEWWYDDVDFGDSWSETFETPHEAAESLFDATGVISTSSDWRALAYRQQSHDDGRCDGILITARRSTWPDSVQLATDLINTWGYWSDFIRPDPVVLAETFLAHANDIVAQVATVESSVSSTGGSGVQASIDQRALDRIAVGLRTPEWFVGMLEDISEIVAATGRDLTDEPDPTRWWDRH